MTPAALLMLQDAGLPEAFERVPSMTSGSTIMLVVAWAFVTLLLIWSFVRVLGGPKPS